MRLKALLLITALGAMALPASAQGGYPCQNKRADNQVGGMILGGILGGVLGSNAAARGHKGDGTALGAVLGGAIGAGAGRGSVNCGPPQGYGYPPGSSQYPNPNYGGQYGGDYPPNSGQPYGYGPPPAGAYPSDPGYGGRDSSYGYGDDYGYRSDDRSHGKHHDRLYADDKRGRDDDDYAGRDCTKATQITRLPDGSEIRRPVEACRDSYYGDWQVQN